MTPEPVALISFSSCFGTSKKLPEQRISIERIVLPDSTADRNVDHGRGDFAHQRRQRRYGTAGSQVWNLAWGGSCQNRCAKQDRKRRREVSDHVLSRLRIAKALASRAALRRCAMQGEPWSGPQYGSVVDPGDRRASAQATDFSTTGSDHGQPCCPPCHRACFKDCGADGFIRRAAFLDEVAQAAFCSI
jgi:hypothetical protein